jgi:predicted nucleic acid-binding protein
VRLLFDTNRYADFDRGDADTLRRWELATELWAPFIVLAELRAGFRLGGRSAANERLLHAFLARPSIGVLWPNDRTTAVYATLFAKLRRRGTPSRRTTCGLPP